MNPLAKKLLVKPGQTWLVLNAPESYLATFDPLPDGVKLVFDAAIPADGIQLFVKNNHELAKNLIQLKATLKPETVIWIMYPKKNSGIDTDLEMMGSWDVLKQYDLRPVASAAINDIWTSLRLRPEHLVKQSDFSKASIQKNDYSAYIDTEKKQITLPLDVESILRTNPAALTVYESLAWSHRKEYMVWILSAKQEQTRVNRITKMVEMLLAGKKNPSDK
ncbi:YdeI family protein [Mucilaginibacter sp.]|jgi:hypothetical protein|uniref:YdeI/OmpD-associated family protein n=1 Tax=Mucilaginibacter sp. TaxID=1882438 RepID=UPI0035681E83